MTTPFGSAFGPSDPFSDLLNRFFGMSPGSSPQVQRVLIGRLLTEPAQHLINRAAQRAEEDGSADLDTGHPLWASTQVEPARSLIARSGADPDALAAELAEDSAGVSGDGAGEPGLTPTAKRTLATAYERAQATGASSIGPKHILGALPSDGDTGALRQLRAAGMDVQGLRGMADGAARPEQASPDGRKPSETLDEFGRDLTEEAKAGKLDPVVGRAEEIEQTVEILSRRSSRRRVRAQGPARDVTEVAERLLLGHGYQPEFGARPLRRTIQSELDNEIASLLLGGEAEPGDTIVADARDGRVVCTVRQEAADKDTRDEKSGDDSGDEDTGGPPEGGRPAGRDAEEG